ncbi:MAG: peptidase C39 family protein [Candidatus Limnocylindria bacterium]
MQPAPYVGPGQVAWFQFGVKAPLIPGTYRLAIRPLVEGALWLEDYGVFWIVTVLQPDGSPPAAAGPSGSTPVAFTSFDVAAGAHAGTSGAGGSVRLTEGTTAGSWTSLWATTAFGFSELVASWNADTPAGSWIEIAMQATPDGVRETAWYALGRWAYGDGDIARSSVNGQSDGDGTILTDTFRTHGQTMRAYRLRVTLHRGAATMPTPALTLAAAVASDWRAARPLIPSPVGAAAGATLAVPPYSQEIHAGEYPQYDGGGEAWCSPTSTAMVLSYWGRGPSADELAWVDPRFADPQVDHAARFTYDQAYRGTGNWPFNTAYAARFGLRGFVTQLRSLAEAERFLAAGIPLVASITVGPNALPGFLFGQGTAGHLLVIVGVTAAGDVVANDPAATNNATVRRVYPRAAFERSWLLGSGGTVYVIHPDSVALPPRLEGHTANW